MYVWSSQNDLHQNHLGNFKATQPNFQLIICSLQRHCSVPKKKKKKEQKSSDQAQLENEVDFCNICYVANVQHLIFIISSATELEANQVQ